MDDMDENQDDSEDPEEAGGEHATLDQVAEALAKLGPRDHGRIELVGRLMAVGTALSAGDLVNTAVERLLAGRRHWHRKETIVGCLARTMKSVVRDWWRRKQAIEITAEADALFVEDDNGEETGIVDRAASDDADPERALIARRAFDELKAALQDDKNTWEIALARAQGETPEDIRYAYDLTETEYDSALKRLNRALKRLKASGDRT